MELGKNEKEIENELKSELHLLIEKTISWYGTKKAAEKALKTWENF